MSHKKCPICHKSELDGVQFVEVKVYPRTATPIQPELDLIQLINKQQKFFVVQSGDFVCSDHFHPRPPSVKRYTSYQRPVPLDVWSPERSRKSTRKPPIERDTSVAYVPTPVVVKDPNTPTQKMRRAKKEAKEAKLERDQSRVEVEMLIETRNDNEDTIESLRLQIALMTEELSRLRTTATVDQILESSKKMHKDTRSWYGVADVGKFYDLLTVCLLFLFICHAYYYNFTV